MTYNKIFQSKVEGQFLHKFVLFVWASGKIGCKQAGSELSQTQVKLVEVEVNVEDGVHLQIQWWVLGCGHTKTKLMRIQLKVRQHGQGGRNSLTQIIYLIVHKPTL